MARLITKPFLLRFKVNLLAISGIKCLASYNAKVEFPNKFFVFG